MCNNRIYTTRRIGSVITEMLLLFTYLSTTLAVFAQGYVQIPVVNPPHGYLYVPSAPNSYHQNYTYNYTTGCKSNAVNSTGSHDMLVGCVKDSDRLLYTQQFTKTPLWYKSREKIVEYPGTLPAGLLPVTEITGIRVFDNNFNGSGGYCSITSGGVGYRHARLRLYSKSAGKGFSFTVKIYGR